MSELAWSHSSPRRPPHFYFVGAGLGVVVACFISLAACSKSSGKSGPGSKDGSGPHVGGGTGTGAGAADAQEPLTLAVAASLRKVMPPLIDAFRATDQGADINATFGASGDLQKQVEGGAPIDAVLFASAKPVDQLIAGGHLLTDTRKVVATNQLVLIGPKDRRSTLTFATIDQLPAGEMLAIGEPGAVPAGQYAKGMLEKLGKWQALDGRLVFGGDVAGVLAYARRGEVVAAIVYQTDTLGIDDIQVLDTARGPAAPRAEVVVGVVKDSNAAPRARRFLDFVASPAGQKLLAAAGFGPP